jgi:hypothetical protein
LLRRRANVPDTAVDFEGGDDGGAVRVRRLRARSIPTSKKLLPPRRVLSTEPIICSGPIANPGRQSASAFATKRALGRPYLHVGFAKLTGDHCRAHRRAADGIKVASGFDFVNFKFQNCAFGKAKRNLIN